MGCIILVGPRVDFTKQYKNVLYQYLNLLNLAPKILDWKSTKGKSLNFRQIYMLCTAATYSMQHTVCLPIFQIELTSSIKSLKVMSLDVQPSAGLSVEDLS